MKCKTFFLILLAVTLAGCGSSEKKLKFQCPQTAIIRDLEKMDDYGAERPDDANLVARASMNSLDGECRYQDNGADIYFILKIGASKGPRLGGNKISFPFFVSIVDPEQRVISKEMMTANFVFHGDDKKAEREETLHVFIPSAKNADLSNYQVLTGFQLTEEQLAAIRKAK